MDRGSQYHQYCVYVPNKSMDSIQLPPMDIHIGVLLKRNLGIILSYMKEYNLV